MHRIYYSKALNDDTLFVVFHAEKTPNKVEKKGDVVALYSEDELIGINLLHASAYLDFDPQGMVAKEEEALLEKLNGLFSEVGLPKLEKNPCSGYAVAKITKLEEHPLDEKKQIVTLSLKGETLETTTRYANIEVGSLVVVALDGCFKFDGTCFHKAVIRNIRQDCELCSPADLRLGEDYKNAYLPQDKEEGADFFA